MEMSEIIANIGKDKYDEACSAARKVAARTGMALGGSDFNSAVPHDISGQIWDSAGDSQDKPDLTFRFYEEMPCYGYLMYVSMYFGEFSTAAKAILWSKYREYLAGDDALAGPATYSLWCDFFEDQTRVQEAWGNLTDEISNELLIQRILDSSGPVPFAEKEELYQRLLPNPKWHHAIFQSLLHSQFDVYGSIDKKKAKAVLRQLALPADTENLETLRIALQQ